MNMVSNGSIEAWKVNGFMVRRSLKNSLEVAAQLLLSLFIVACTASGAGSKSRETVDEEKKAPAEIQWITKTEKGKEFIYGGGNYGRKLEFGGASRFYELHVPRKYNKSKPMPVVMVFHGGGSHPSAVRYESGMDVTSDREGFIVVYPAGSPRSKLFKERFLVWNDGRSFEDGSANKVDDVGFVVAVLDDLETFFRMDSSRVYAAGYSNGAQFVFRLAQQLSNRVAAIAAVAGQRSPDEFFSPPPRPMPVMQFSGMKDTIGPYNGGTPSFKADFKTNLKPVKQTIQAWAAFNGCHSTPIVNRRGKAVETRYSSCREGTEVILWTLEDGGHTWPGGKTELRKSKWGETININKDISASDVMWSFFIKFSIR